MDALIVVALVGGTLWLLRTLIEKFTADSGRYP